MDRVESAGSCFEEGFNCSQAVFSSFGPGLGLDRETALKVAGPFGAVTGAFMVIGLRHGRTKADDEETRDRAYGLVREFVAEFESRNGSVICRKMLGFDIGTPEGLDRARQENLRGTRCRNFVRDAAGIIEQMLE